MTSDEDMSSMGTTTIGEWHRDPRDQHGYANRDGGPKLIQFESPRWRPKSSSSSSRSPRAAINAQDTYEDRFGRSLYGWKDNFKELPMAPVLGPNSFEVNGNCWNNRTSRIYHGAATPSFGLLTRVSCWGPLWTWLGRYARPNHHIISSHQHIRARVLLVLVFLVKLRFICCNCGDKSFYNDPGPSFLFYTTVEISPFVIRGWTPSWFLLHTHLQFQIACLPFLACVLRFTCRKSLCKDHRGVRP